MANLLDPKVTPQHDEEYWFRATTTTDTLAGRIFINRWCIQSLWQRVVVDITMQRRDNIFI